MQSATVPARASVARAGSRAAALVPLEALPPGRRRGHTNRPGLTPADDTATTTCPECGRTATVRRRAVLDSTDGPIEHARVDCPAGHWLMLPIATLDRIRPVRTAARATAG
jgi:hypothetical protein